MEEVDILFKKIDEDIVEYYLSNKWGRILELQDEMKILINEVLDMSNLNKSDYLVLRRILNYLSEIKNLETGGSWKRKHVKSNGEEFQKILDIIPLVEEEKIDIKDLDEWIKNLKIYRPSGKWNEVSNNIMLNPRKGFTVQEEYGTYTWISNGLGSEDDYYKTSYQVYTILRQIILNKKIPKYKKVYAEWVVNKIYNNLDTLPNNIKLEDDYELSILVKLIHDNQEFNSKNNSSSILDMHKLEVWDSVNYLKSLIKR